MQNIVRAQYLGDDHLFSEMVAVLSTFQLLNGEKRCVIESELGGLYICKEYELKYDDIVDFKEPNASETLVADRVAAVGLVDYNKRQELIAKLYGPTSILVQHLSPKVINGGKGIIEHCVTLPQYESDIINLSSARLADWPNGFYRNAETKECQLLLSGKGNCIVRIDKLPGQQVNVVISDRDVAKESNNFLSLSTMDMEVFINMLDDYLKMLSTVHNFNLKG